jgi:hypothetical protein
MDQAVADYSILRRGVFGNSVITLPLEIMCFPNFYGAAAEF